MRWFSETFFGYPFMTAKVLIQNKQPVGAQLETLLQRCKVSTLLKCRFQYCGFPVEWVLLLHSKSLLSGVLAGLVVTHKCILLIRIRSDPKRISSLD